MSLECLIIGMFGKILYTQNVCKHLSESGPRRACRLAILQLQAGVEVEGKQAARQATEDEDNS